MVQCPLAILGFAISVLGALALKHNDKVLIPGALALKHNDKGQKVHPKFPKKKVERSIQSSSIDFITMIQWNMVSPWDFNYVKQRLRSKKKGYVQQKSVKTHNGPRDLAFMHVPFNFGHTIEKVAMFPESVSFPSASGYLGSLGLAGGRKASWREVNLLAKDEGEIWGHWNPDLQDTSNVTGCDLYYTPQKYWPQHLLEKYFGNKTVFGVLRDPYERLVAFFRGNLKEYGGSYPEFFKKCDVNGAVKLMMKEHIATGNIFDKGCTFIPQAEFFDGPYGIKLPIDNRKFPASANKLLLEHGYEDMQIAGKDIFHVSGCDHVWSGDFDAETRSLVQQVYKRDFELLCKHFGYCDLNENTCISQVPEMCPSHVLGLMSQKNGAVLKDNPSRLSNLLRPDGGGV